MVAARETRQSLIAEQFVSARPGYEDVYLGDVFKLSNEKLGKHEIEPEVFSISKHDGIVLSSDYFDHRIASKDLDGYKILEPADWAYSTIHIDEGSIARNNTALSGVVSPMYTTMKWSTSDCDPGFFEVLLRSDVALNLYGNSAQGSVKRRKSLSFQRFAGLKFSVPKLSAQIELLEKVSMLDRSIEALALQLKTIHSLELSIMSEVFDVDAI